MATTLLESGMVFAVDGGITVLGDIGARVGDTVKQTPRVSNLI
jgi:Xaa-Pro aminopeptidase